MRVLHLTPLLFDEADGVIGGAERYSWELARYMSQRVDTTLLSFGTRTREFHEGKLRVRVIGGAWKVRGNQFNPFSVRVLPEILRADVIHCHQQHILLSSLSALAGRLAGRKVFVTDLGGGGWDVSGYVSTDAWYHGHLHISEFSRRISGHQNEPRARVILNGVDVEKFSPDPSVPKTGGLLAVGRILPHKGIDRVIEALPPDIPLDVVGRAYHPAYLELLRGLAQGKKVRFHLDFDDRLLVDTYRRARGVVLASVYKDRYGGVSSIPELLGQTLIEGMACGLPAICTRVGGMPETMVPDVTGFVVPADDSSAMRDALERVWRDPDRAAVMGAAGRVRMVETFTWPAVVQRCLDAYAAPPAESSATVK